jgi:hypothetical protein
MVDSGRGRAVADLNTCIYLVSSLHKLEESHKSHGSFDYTISQNLSLGQFNNPWRKELHLLEVFLKLQNCSRWLNLFQKGNFV